MGWRWVSTTWTKIEISSSGDNTVITPGSGKALRVVKLMFISDAAVDVKIVEGTSGEGQTDLTGPMALPANGGFAYDADRWPLKLAANKSLVINLSSGIGVNGFAVTYEE